MIESFLEKNQKFQKKSSENEIKNARMRPNERVENLSEDVQNFLQISVCWSHFLRNLF